MAQDYSEYLAINVLNEQQIVSYRTLTRALKVHCNLAKQMLYEFHRKQNAKKAGSVHATYWITGVRKPQPAVQTNGIHSQDGEDPVMESSPPLPGSSAPERHDEAEEKEKITVRLMALAKEEDLEAAKSQFASISSVHIYSLEHGTLNDLHVLTECNRRIATSYAAEDPLEAWKQYGTIRNPNVKRRTRRKAPPPAAPEPTTAAAKAKPLPPSKKHAELEKQTSDTRSAAESSTKPTPEPEKPAAPKKGMSSKPAQVRRQDSNIFKSFAKGETKLRKKETDSSAGASAAAEPKDELMKGMSEDEADDSGLRDEDKIKAPTGKSKRQREEELQAMMDEADEPMKDAPAVEPEAESPAEAAAPIDVDTAESQQSNEPAETVTISNGRRRGRRRIMKKKTVKDEEGYLVTKEEPAWESFSEDEPAPKKIKVPPAASGIGAEGKKGGKPGQGRNIMSFFAKK